MTSPELLSVASLSKVTRTQRVEKYVGILPRLSPFKFVFIYAVMTVLWISITSPSDRWLNWYISIMWSLYLPAALIGVGRVLVKGKSVVVQSNFRGMTSHKVIFVVPTVCRQNTLPALKRVIVSIVKYAPRNLLVWRVDIVVDEGAEAVGDLAEFVSCFKEVRILVVPSSYRTKLDTKYKARANHYAAEQRRQEGDATDKVYVYHLDDDTHIGEDTAASIAEFIRRYHGKYFLAQGILTFPHELSPSVFCRLADSIRPADDVTRCGLFTGDLGTPLAGLHGEHLLIRADIENIIGWDFGDTLVEDAFFALRFAELYPHKSRVLHSFSYGASPGTIRDLIRQRRRWAAGLFGLIWGKNNISFRMKLPLMYMMICWVCGPFHFVGFVLIVAWLSGTGNTSPVVLWGIFPWTFSLAFSVWQYIEGLKINMAVSEQQEHYFLLSLALIPLIYLFALVEGFAALCGFARFIKKDLSFEVIRKES